MASTPVVKKWCGDPICDICLQPPKEYFVDGRTRGGPWALMCEHCWPLRGCGQLGKGSGQKYDAVTKEKLED